MNLSNIRYLISISILLILACEGIPKHKKGKAGFTNNIDENYAVRNTRFNSILGEYVIKNGNYLNNPDITYDTVTSFTDYFELEASIYSSVYNIEIELWTHFIRNRCYISVFVINEPVNSIIVPFSEIYWLCEESRTGKSFRENHGFLREFNKYLSDYHNVKDLKNEPRYNLESALINDVFSSLLKFNNVHLQDSSYLRQIPTYIINDSCRNILSKNSEILIDKLKDDTIFKSDSVYLYFIDFPGRPVFELKYLNKEVHKIIGLKFKIWNADCYHPFEI